MNSANYGSLSDNKIVNRCYTGYSFKRNCPSFVHGNLICVYYDSKEQLQPAYVSNHGKYSYTIQRPFAEDLCLYELFLVNPTDRDQVFEIDSQTTKLRPCETTLNVIESCANVVTLKSSFELPRPIIIKVSNNFVDVHHA